MIAFKMHSGAGFSGSKQVMYLSTPASGAIACSKSAEIVLEPDTDYIVRMTPVPRGFRMATYADRVKPKPGKTMYLGKTGEFITSSAGSSWEPDLVYVVPVDPPKPETVPVTALPRVGEPACCKIVDIPIDEARKWGLV